MEAKTQQQTQRRQTDEMKVQINPLKRDFTIIEASGKSLEILGTAKMYLEAEVLEERKIIEASVIEGNTNLNRPAEKKLY